MDGLMGYLGMTWWELAILVPILMVVAMLALGQ